MKTGLNGICLIILSIVFNGCHNRPENYYESGVSLFLAEQRKSIISELSYTLRFEIPPDVTLPVTGEELIDFDIKGIKSDLLVDFRESPDKIKEIKLNGAEPQWIFSNDHIVISRKDITQGHNQLLIGFEAGDLSLNRNNEYLYTLFVPDRASTAFPCFDQPDLKATFKLKLVIDSSWNAIANNPLIEESSVNGKKILEFDKGKPISTYLFAFAAGKFRREERSVDGIKMEMLHRETREDLVTMNIEEIFALHSKAIRWLEEYTGIEYPFDKFGFILIPSFQYGGMEHPGSIYYRAASLLLEENPSINQELSRASLIAHETSHIWFGDLVTMEWFNDVWLKEVFAGYMSDKITNPSFPEINHDLRFLLGRYPAAYSVDRTAGTNPVIQELDNMKNAGTLYGAIIYNKAPIIMKHLELLMGEDSLRNGLRRYLADFSFGNAKWDDLVGILDPMSGSDIRTWSDIWVKEAGRPGIATEIDSPGSENSLVIGEYDNSGKGRHWPQSIHTLVLFEDGSDTAIIDELSAEAGHHLFHGIIQGFIPAYNGITYGFIRMSPSNIDFLLHNLKKFKEPFTRGVILLNINENMLEGIIDPAFLMDAITERIIDESDPLLMSQLRGMINNIFWNHLDSEARNQFTYRLERAILEKIRVETSSSEKRSWFNTYISVSASSGALDLIYNTWKNKSQYAGIRFNEPDFINMACILALKKYPGSEDILEEQALRISNNDRKEEFMFIIQPLNSSEKSRDEFFRSLKEESNREHEPWVGRALSYLHHPLNSESSVRYIPESLALLEEIQQTGDIFFPGQWISATLEGHNSEEAFSMVEEFLESNPDYPPNLKLKILQAADHLYRRYGN